MIMIHRLKHNQRLLGACLLLIGIAILIVPITYYGYIDYVIHNSAAQVSQDNITLELKNAAIHLYNGHPIKQIKPWILFSMGLVGALFIYLSAFLLFKRADKIKQLFTFKYWQEFKLLP